MTGLDSESASKRLVVANSGTASTQTLEKASIVADHHAHHLTRGETNVTIAGAETSCMSPNA